MIIGNGRIFREDGSFEQGNLYVQDGRIVSREDYRGPEGQQDLDASGLYVIPGLTDIHFHGCMGHDFCDGTREALEQIAEYQLANGVTAICPASMTFPEEKLAGIFRNAAAFKAGQEESRKTEGRTLSGGADLVGINMEGPFIAMAKKGAQNGAYIQRPDADKFFRLQEAAGGLVRLVDIAPEVDGGLECIGQIAGQVRVSLAHTTADYDTAKEAFAKGACHVTHLYNAMPPFSHRAPGVVGAACDTEGVMAELICDGVHIHPASVRTTFRMFGDERIILISDSMMACGLEDGQYTLGGQDVTVRGNVATLTREGNIAGSVTNLMECLRTAVKVMGIPLASAVKCAAVNPAKAIGIYDRRGSLAPGKQADVVLLDEDLKIRGIVKDGVVVKKTEQM